MAPLVEMYKHLHDHSKRARLTALRGAVAPILANNLLPYFTAHDVEHCDRVTAAVDSLIEPLQTSANPLSADELFVVYAAAYLHDIGMHYENVGESSSVRDAIGTQTWESIPSEVRRDLLRQLHPAISAELVARSVRNATPPIAFQLIDDDHPPAIASLCEAHGIDTGSQRFADLTVDGPGLRTRLLVGILRCADILEESRRRANRGRAESLLLPIESQVHWWRHYYTADVRYYQAERAIELWFEFPSSRRTELERIVPELQLPEVRAEFARHHQVFAPHNLSWFVQSRVSESPHQTVEDLPEAVLREMLLAIARHRETVAEEYRRASAAVYDEARPQIERRLDELRRVDADLTPEAAAKRLREIAVDMGRFGAKASARSLMREAFAKAENADTETRLSIGLELSQLLVVARAFDEAVRLNDRLLPLVSALTPTDSRVSIYWDTKIDAEIRAGRFENGMESIRQRQGTNGQRGEADQCRAAELDFLEGRAERTMKHHDD